MIIIKTISITETDRKLAIKARDNTSEFMACSCIVAQAIKREFPVRNPYSITVHSFFAMIDGLKYDLDEAARKLAAVRKLNWDTCELPNQIVLTLNVEC